MGINPAAIAALLGNKPKNKGKKEGFKSDFNYFFLPREACEVTLRFMPPHKGKDFPGLLTHQHKDIPNPDPKAKWPLKINSLVEFLGDKDPMERVLSRYRGKLDLKDFEKITYSHFNVQVKKVKVNGSVVTKDFKDIAYDPDECRLLRTWGDFNFYWLLERCVDEDFGDITDAEGGFNVKFTRKEEGGSFERQVLPKPQPLGKNEEEINTVLGKMVDFAKVWRHPDDEYVKRAKEVAAVVEAELEKRLKREEEKDKMIEDSDNREEDMSENTEKVEKKSPVMEDIPFESSPKGSPDCFGNGDLLYSGHKSEEDAEEAKLEPDAEAQLEKCQECVFESSCAEKVGR